MANTKPNTPATPNHNGRLDDILKRAVELGRVNGDGANSMYMLARAVFDGALNGTVSVVKPDGDTPDDSARIYEAFAASRGRNTSEKADSAKVQASKLRRMVRLGSLPSLRAISSETRTMRGVSFISDVGTVIGKLAKTERGVRQYADTLTIAAAQLALAENDANAIMDQDAMTAVLTAEREPKTLADHLIREHKTLAKLAKTMTELGHDNGRIVAAAASVMAELETLNAREKAAEAEAAIIAKLAAMTPEERAALLASAGGNTPAPEPVKQAA